MEKKTKKEMFAQIKAKLSDPAEIEFIEHEIELLNKKSSAKRKPTKIQEFNEVLKLKILNVLDKDKGVTASEVLTFSEDFDGMSNQKISTLLHQLANDGKVINYKDGKKSLFKLA